MLGAGAVVDSVRVFTGDDVVEIGPRAFRHLLLTFDDSIQGNIPAILGDDKEERVDTLVTLLRGTSDDDMRELLAALQVAVGRLADERIRRRTGAGTRSRHRRSRRR
jgi:hypothetical protein